MNLRDKLAQGDIEGPLAQLRVFTKGTRFSKYAIILSSRYSRIKKDGFMSTMKPDDLNIQKSRLICDILDLADNIQDERPDLIQAAFPYNPKIIISYTPDSSAHQSWVYELSCLLNGLNIDCWIDQILEGRPPENGWHDWICRKAYGSDFILMILSENYVELLKEDWKSNGISASINLNVVLGSDFIKYGIDPSKIILASRSNNPIPLLPVNYQDMDIIQLSDEWNLEEIGIRIGIPSLNEQSSKFDSQDQSSNENDQSKEPDNEVFIEILTKMKAGPKIVQAFYSLPLSDRIEIGKKLHVLEAGEGIHQPRPDLLSKEILIRAREKGHLAELWLLLFPESDDPNPFK